MKKIIFFAGLLCVGSIVDVNAVEGTINDNYQTSVELSQGYRSDSLNLRLGGHSSKRHFKNVDEYTTRVGATVRKDDFFLKGVAGYGDVYDGKLHRGNGSHTSKVHGDYTADFAVTFGKDLRYSDGWGVSPTVGYGVYVQDFHTSKHHSSKDRVKGTWYSPQAGLSVSKVCCDTMNVYASYMCLFPLNFQATRHHNTQTNKAYKSIGNIGTIGLEWDFADNWSLKPEIQVMKFYSHNANSSHHHHSKDTERSAAEFRVAVSYMF